MRERERENKFEEGCLPNAGGDLRRIGDFGSKVRKKCSTNSDLRETDTSIESVKASGEGRSVIAITPQFVEIMYFGTDKEQARGAKLIRKFLSSAEPPIGEVVEAGLLPILVSLLKSQSEAVQYEAAWSLTNILTGSSLYVRYVVEAGAVETFVKLLSSRSEDVQEQCAWALANVAGDLDDFRMFALEKGAMSALLNMMEEATSLELLRRGAWAVCHLCVNNPDFENISPAIPVLSRFLSHDDLDLVYNCIAALVHLSEGKERIPDIINNGVVQSVIKLLATGSEFLVPQLLEIILNVSQGTEEHIDYLVSCNVLSVLKRWFESYLEPVRHSASYIVANMTRGNLKQIDYVVRNKFVIQKMCTLLKTDSERVIKQAVFTLRNISNGGCEEHLLLLTYKSFLHRLCALLPITDNSTKLAALTCLENLMEFGEQWAEKDSYNQVALAVENCGGLQQIEDLQSHDNQDIYHKAYDIMEKYFCSEELNCIVRPHFK